MVKLSGWMQGPWRFIAAALLLVIVAHATAPVAQPFDRGSGSAFNAASSDVSLACSQRVLLVQQVLPDNNAPPLPHTGPEAWLPHAFQDCQPHSTGLGPTGPPLAQTSLHPLNPRAPPAA